MQSKRVVILGGGFAGVKCARVLRKRFRSAALEVVLFNRENHMVFHPMLAEVAGGSINPEAVAAPLRQMLPGVLHRSEAVDRFDPEGKRVLYTGFDGRPRELAYEHLVIACGSVVNLGMVPGMADHAFPMKTVGDAVALRAHVMERLEQAEVCDDKERKRWLLSIVVVGGGYSGVETAGELNDLVRGSARWFANIEPEDVQVVVVHSRDELLPEISSSLRDFTKTKMEGVGIQVVLNERVTAATPDGVMLKSGRQLSGGTVVCTVGNTASPVVERYSGPKERGRLLTQADMRLEGQDSIWAAGDCAVIQNAHDGQPSPPTGQFAERQGRQCAENVARVIQGLETRPFSFKVLGQLCSIGHHSAVAELMGLRISGFVAWCLWRGIYLMKMPSWSRRMKVGFDWAWQLVFSRDLSHLKADTTERVSRAYYQEGDFIFHEGDVASSFYAIETGEVEVVREAVEGSEAQVLAILGPGDFFGEMALVKNEARSAGVRARTAVEVVVMGKGVFGQLSGSMSVMRDLMGDAVRRRGSDDLWRNLPAARAILDSLSARECAVAADERGGTLDPAATFEDCLAHFESRSVDFVCVVDSGGVFHGVLEPADLFRALESGAGCESAVAEFARSDITTIRAGDTAMVAATTLRDQNTKALPVLADDGSRQLEGVIEVERLVSRVLREVPGKLGPLGCGGSEGGS